MNNNGEIDNGTIMKKIILMAMEMARIMKIIMNEIMK